MTKNYKKDQLSKTNTIQQILEKDKDNKKKVKKKKNSKKAILLNVKNFSNLFLEIL